MNEVDTLINENLVPFRKRVVDDLVRQHPLILGMIDKFLAGKNNKVGMRVTENGNTVGEYTFHLNGLQISDVAVWGVIIGVTPSHRNYQTISNYREKRLRKNNKR